MRLKNWKPLFRRRRKSSRDFAIPETAMNKEAGVRVLALNSEFYAEKVSDTFEESIDVCMDALSKQLLKAKEKQQGK